MNDRLMKAAIAEVEPPLLPFRDARPWKVSETLCVLFPWPFFQGNAMWLIELDSCWNIDSITFCQAQQSRNPSLCHLCSHL